MYKIVIQYNIICTNIYYMSSTRNYDNQCMVCTRKKVKIENDNDSDNNGLSFHLLRKTIMWNSILTFSKIVGVYFQTNTSFLKEAWHHTMIETLQLMHECII